MPYIEEMVISPLYVLISLHQQLGAEQRHAAQGEATELEGRPQETEKQGQGVLRVGATPPLPAREAEPGSFLCPQTRVYLAT